MAAPRQARQAGPEGRVDVDRAALPRLARRRHVLRAILPRRPGRADAADEDDMAVAGHAQPDRRRVVISPSRVVEHQSPRHACGIFLSGSDIGRCDQSRNSHKDMFISISELMLSPSNVTLDTMVDTLKAAAESSRLRILALLSRGDLTVSDLTEILNQSQPRVSRHLKLLLEAGLIGRYQEGSWAFFRLSDAEVAREFVQGLVSRVHEGDPQIERDLERLGAVKRRRQERAACLFQRATPQAGTRSARCMRPIARWRRRLLKLVGKRPFQSMLDLGTGTGPAAGIVRAALPPRRRHRHVARNAGGGPRQSRQGRRRAMRRSARATSSRRRSSATPSIWSPCTRCCTISTTRQRRSARRRGCLRPAGPAGDRRFRAACAGVPARGSCASAPRLFRPADRRVVRGSRARPRGDPGFRAARRRRRRR